MNSTILNFLCRKMFCFLKSLNITYNLSTVLWKMWHWHLFLNSEQRKIFVTLSAYNCFFNITIPLYGFTFVFYCWYSYNNDIIRFILARSSWFISSLQPSFPKFLWVPRTMPAHLSSPFIFCRTVSSNSRSLQQRFESFKIIMPK